MSEGTNDSDANGVDANLSRHGKVSYLEIPAIDIEASAAFYEALFGWQIVRRGPTNVSFFDTSGDLIGRWVPGRPASTTPGFLPYVYVDDVEAIIAAASKLGSRVDRAPYPEGNLIVATIVDPAGNVIGIWQSSE